MTNTKESMIKVVRNERGRFAKSDIWGNFKVGDRIRLLENHWAVVEKCKPGTIAKLEKETSKGVFFCSPIPGFPKGFYFSPDPSYTGKVELIEEAPTPRPFKVGDVVRCLDKNYSNHYRQIGVIISGSTFEDKHIYEVRFNDGIILNYFVYEMELVPNAPKQRKAERKPDDRPFKVGDRVTGESNIGTTETGIITEDDGRPLHLYNQHYKVNGVWMLTNTLKLVPKNPKKGKKNINIVVPEEIPAALQTLAKAFGYRVEKA